MGNQRELAAARVIAAARDVCRYYEIVDAAMYPFRDQPYDSDRWLEEGAALHRLLLAQRVAIREYDAAITS